MHVCTDQGQHADAVAIVGGFVLLRPSTGPARLLPGSLVWENSRLLTERRHGERRRHVRSDFGRRRADCVSVLEDLELAVMERRAHEAARWRRA